jgi:hypothetical protein
MVGTRLEDVWGDTQSQQELVALYAAGLEDLRRELHATREAKREQERSIVEGLWRERDKLERRLR